MPPWHCVPAPQRLPHAPQLLLSVCSLTQEVPHTVVPPVHESEHIPFVQVCVPAHTLPHAPQSFGLEVVSMHVPLQAL